MDCEAQVMEADELINIREMSERSSVPASTLRYYEKLGLITSERGAWASRISFLCPCRNGFAYVGGTCFTSWPSAASSRAT